jgi:hypothetical protein
LLNARLRAAWEVRYAALLEGRVFPDCWNPIARMYLERRLRVQRLEARQWLKGLAGRKRAEAIAKERWFRRRRINASSPHMS